MISLSNDNCNECLSYLEERERRHRRDDDDDRRRHRTDVRKYIVYLNWVFMTIFTVDWSIVNEVEWSVNEWIYQTNYISILQMYSLHSAVPLLYFLHLAFKYFLFLDHHFFVTGFQETQRKQKGTNWGNIFNID